ncbi:MAG: amine oxidase [Sphingobacteriales bacterium]|nr:MAG: amine oxidase [Sphingobacteriales bacterium]
MQNPFSSFWIAGYECSDQLNCFGDRVDLLQATRHLEHIEADYIRLREFSISTVREGVQWSCVETSPYVYDWTNVVRVITVARQLQVQVIWDLCHFGYPSDLTTLHPQFSKRFVAFALAFLEQYRSLQPEGVLIVTPINEVNFMSWLGGEVGATSPYTKNYGWEVKYHLMQAYIQCVKAMKVRDSQLRVLVTEPLINIVPDNLEDINLINKTREKNEEQFQMLDILCGYICRELGGNDDLADIIGCNYYHNNQWYYPSGRQLDWCSGTAITGYRKLSELCREVSERYKRPIVITETSYEGGLKGEWLNFITDECEQMLHSGLELFGICIYPVLNRPDWDYPERWHDSGIWKINRETFERSLDGPYGAAINHCINKLLPASVPAFLKIPQL